MAEELSYKLSADGAYYIVERIKEKGVTELVIPASYNGKPVCRIAERAFYQCKYLQRVTLPEGMRTIGHSAFACCYALEQIRLPDSLLSIGERAFSFCDELQAVTIGRGVTSIGGFAFYGCGKLQSITIVGGVTSIGEDAFCRCNRLTDIVFENPNGWKAEELTISPEVLSQKQTAVKYLTESYYCSRHWVRTE